MLRVSHHRLAYVDDHRWVALCSHGVLHIRWNYFSLHLPVPAFRQVGMLVCWFSVMDMILFRNMLLLANGALAQSDFVEEPSNAPPIDELINIPFSTN